MVDTSVTWDEMGYVASVNWDETGYVGGVHILIYLYSIHLGCQILYCLGTNVAVMKC